MKRTLTAIFLSATALLAAQTATSTQRTISDTKEYVGSIYSHKETMIATRMMGYIKKINVEEGDIVKKGQLLFEVDPSDIESQIQQAESGVLSAKIQHLDAKADYERFKELKEKGAVPDRDFEKMKLKMELTELQLKMASAQLEQAKAQLKYTSVTAPIDGIVVQKMAKEAELAKPGHPVLVLSDINELRARAMVKESDIPHISVGMPVEIYVSAMDKTIKSKIASLVPSGDPATHSYMIRADLPDMQGVLPGMYAKIAIDLKERSGVVVPAGSITQRGGITGVFVDERGTARFYPVTIKNRMKRDVEVEGLDAGVKVLVYPGADVQDGQPIK